MKNLKRIKVKICLIGDPCVGKTTLIQQYIFNSFSDSYIHTIGARISRKVMQINNLNNGPDYALTTMIWDIMGHKMINFPLDKYLKLSQGALIVCDITRPETFANLLDWKNKLFSVCGKVPIMYLANKIDLQKKIKVNTKEFEEFIKKEGVNCYFTSAKTGENVENAFFKLGYLIVKSLPKSPLVTPKQIIAPSVNVNGQAGLGLDHGHGPAVGSPMGMGCFAQVQKPNAITPKRTVMRPKVPGKYRLSKLLSVKINDFQIKPGAGYVIKEEKPEQSFKIFKELLKKDFHGLCITRMHPERIRGDFQLEKIPLYWLSTDASVKKNVVAPTFLLKLNTIIDKFIKENNNAVILLEGIEYLIEQNGFKTILNLVHSLNDCVMGSNARLLIPIDPCILEERELHMLTRDFRIVKKM